jgi:hypothetical protein
MIRLSHPGFFRVLQCLLVLSYLVYAPHAVAADTAALSAVAQLSDARPYQRQTVILRLRVSHSASVSGLDVEPVQAPDFSLEPVAGPPRTTRMTGLHQMTTDFVYALTPLAGGAFTLPSLRVHGMLEGVSAADGSPVTRVLSAGTKPVALDVQVLPEGTGALLPLHALDVQLRYDGRARLQVGQPIRIGIVQNAAGVAGERLGSAMELLESPDFRVYPGRTSTSTRLARNGQLLHGQRIDYLTIVPQRDGLLKLPAVTLNWWDIGAGRMENTLSDPLPLEVLPVPGSLPASESKPPASDGPAADSAAGTIRAVVIGAVFAFAAGWWLRGHGMQDASSRLADFLHTLRARAMSALQGIRAFFKGLSVRFRRGQHNALGRTGMTVLHRRLHLLHRLPKPAVRWRETTRLRRAIDMAENARALAQYLQDWGVRVLGLPFQTPLVEMGQTLVLAYPRVDAERVQRLLAILDASLYGGRQNLELDAWKRDFIDQLDRIGIRKPFRAAHDRPAGLPVLNPV